MPRTTCTSGRTQGESLTQSMWKTALVFHSSKGHANKLCIMQSSAAAASLKDAAEGQRLGVLLLAGRCHP